MTGYGSLYSDRYSPCRNDELSCWLGRPIAEVSTDTNPGPGSCRGVPQFVEHALPGLSRIDAQLAAHIEGEFATRVAFVHAQQAEQQVLGADVGVVQGAGFLQREGQ